LEDVPVADGMEKETIARVFNGELVGPQLQGTSPAGANFLPLFNDVFEQ
jgi:hypothetical protein